MAVVRVGESQLFYRLEGRHGDPVAFIHGSLSDHHTFDRTGRSLAGSLQVLTYDRRGYGQSVGPPKANAVREDAADLAGLLEIENFYPVHLIAHSYGGAVAFRLALDRPELVRSIAIHEPPFIGLLRDDPATRSEGERLDREADTIRDRLAAGGKEEATRRLVEAFSTDADVWSRLPAPTRAQLVRYVDQWDQEFRDPEASRPPAAELEELLLPVLLTVGGKSPPYVRQIVELLDRHLKNAVVEELRDVDHIPQVDQPDEYAGVLVTFLLERDVPST